MDKWLVIFVKAPVMGRVKTRLANGIGAVAATAFYRIETARLIRKVSNDTRWHTVLAVSPDQASFDGSWAEQWPEDLPRVPQGRGDLGDRMQRCFEAMPPGPVMIIGSDIPDITNADIAAGFATLGDHDVTVGPADDGGYWLIGQKRMPKPLRLFDDVEWSTDRVLQKTLTNLPARAKYAMLGTIDDIDTAEDLARYREQTRGKT